MDLETIRARISSYLRDNKELSDKNLKNNMRAVDTIIRIYGITEPNEDNAIRLKQKLRDNGRSNSTIRLYLWAMRYWAEAMGGKLNFNVVALPKIDRVSKVDSSKLVDKQVLHRIFQDEQIPSRDKALIGLMAYCGLRLGEVTGLTLRDISQDEYISLRKTKNGRQRVVPIPREGFNLLRAWMDDRAWVAVEHRIAHDWLFISANGERLSEDSARHVMYRIKRAYGINGKFHPHMLRHTAATMMCRTEGVDIREVQQVLGHSSLYVTEMYTHVDVKRTKSKLDTGMAY